MDCISLKLERKDIILEIETQLNLDKTNEFVNKNQINVKKDTYFIAKYLILSNQNNFISDMENEIKNQTSFEELGYILTKNKVETFEKAFLGFISTKNENFADFFGDTNVLNSLLTLSLSADSNPSYLDKVKQEKKNLVNSFYLKESQIERIILQQKVSIALENTEKLEKQTSEMNSSNRIDKYFQSNEINLCEFLEKFNGLQHKADYLEKTCMTIVQNYTQEKQKLNFDIDELKKKLKFLHNESSLVKKEYQNQKSNIDTFENLYKKNSNLNKESINRVMKKLNSIESSHKLLSKKQSEGYDNLIHLNYEAIKGIEIYVKDSQESYKNELESLQKSLILTTQKVDDNIFDESRCSMSQISNSTKIDVDFDSNNKELSKKFEELCEKSNDTQKYSLETWVLDNIDSLKSSFNLKHEDLMQKNFEIIQSINKLQEDHKDLKNIEESSTNCDMQKEEINQKINLIEKRLKELLLLKKDIQVKFLQNSQIKFEHENKWQDISLENNDKFDDKYQYRVIYNEKELNANEENTNVTARPLYQTAEKQLFKQSGKKKLHRQNFDDKKNIHVVYDGAVNKYWIPNYKQVCIQKKMDM